MEKLVEESNVLRFIYEEEGYSAEQSNGELRASLRFRLANADASSKPQICDVALSCQLCRLPSDPHCTAELQSCFSLQLRGDSPQVRAAAACTDEILAEVLKDLSGYDDVLYRILNATHQHLQPETGELCAQRVGTCNVTEPTCAAPEVACGAAAGEECEQNVAQPAKHTLRATESGTTSLTFGPRKIAVYHGKVTTVKRSTFQAHVARVESREEVFEVLTCLNSNSRFRRATHRIVSYTFRGAADRPVADYDSDGEEGAGTAVHWLMNTLRVTNVVVIVARWFGGILLGPDRFKIINRCTRQILEERGLITVVKK